MGVFYHQEPPNPSRKCKFLSATLRDAFSNCRTCRRLSTSSPEVDYPSSDIDDEQEIVVSAIRSRALEKSRQRSFVLTDSFSWVFSPRTGELFLAPKIFQDKDDNDEKEDEGDEFLSVASCFSCCSSALSKEAFLSVKTNFSAAQALVSFLTFKIFQGVPYFRSCVTARDGHLVSTGRLCCFHLCPNPLLNLGLGVSAAE
ncbi:hypothetical protein GH714_005402 [Hevea brasiliensis]|uniref:Uncharacterized protein n=1 Tax=Hevea brasiliensis TaxID=3981 RepID=A0A6A6M859_HEVBR|nr:hypothetical protein GH714_005402 [Hevea brasiliensis]